jgi:transposase
VSIQPVWRGSVAYARLVELPEQPDHILVDWRATGHYCRNLFAALIARNYQVAVLNPLRTSRFAEDALRRTRTDAIDALGLRGSLSKNARA